MSDWEIPANIFNAAAIVLAMLNSIHTWWTSIVGCLLFGIVFFEARLYADVTLQGFFVVASAAGWWSWLRGNRGQALPVRSLPGRVFAGLVAAALAGAGAYGWILDRFTDAYAPFVDSVVLTFSILGQLLLVRRRYESWWCWLLVNTIAVPLYISRELYVTAVLYVAFWINAVVALVRWRRLIAGIGS
jgi:nicotinamide mononucleotide transporter